MFTLHAFNEAMASAGAYANVKGCADQMTRVVDDIVYIPDAFTKLIWCAALGLDVVQAKLESPSIRRIGVLQVEPKSNYDYDYFKAFPVCRYSGQSPLTFSAGEGLEAFIYCGRSHSNLNTVGVCLGDAPVTPIRGEIWTVRATYAALACVASKWSNGELTFDETLPVGKYQIVGADAWNNDAHLFRFVPVGAMNRPGGICGSGIGCIPPHTQRMGEMGVWCEFHSSTPPSIEFVGDGTTSSGGSVEIDLIKIS